MSLFPAHHIAVVVPDLQQAEAFYEGVLGLPRITRHFTAAGTHRATWLALGEAFLALELGVDGPRRADDSPGLHCLALGIAPAERDRLRARLVAAGIPVEKETNFTFYVRDPGGTLLGFSHHPHDPVAPVA